MASEHVGVNGIQVEEVRDQAAWDGALLALPLPHILQSWAWGESKRQTGWRAVRLLWRDEGRPVAAASLLVRRLGRMPAAVAYVPKGPVLDWNNGELAGAVLDHLLSRARHHRSLFLKIDPDLRSDTSAGSEILQHLQQRGWRLSSEQIQYRNTLVTQLAGDETMLAAMKPKWRYNIRLAERRGVTVRAGNQEDLARFYQMYAETGSRDGFLVRPRAYYEQIWRPFLAQGLAHLLLAELEGETVAGIMLFRFGVTAWYFYGASTAQGREAMPNHALQWAALRWAREQGCTRYDWWGAPDILDESDPMWGVYRFKQGFGAEFTPWIGAWDYPLQRQAYWLYTVAMPRVLDLMRRRK